MRPEPASTHATRRLPPTDLNGRFLWRARALSEHADANSAPARQPPTALPPPLPPPALLTIAVRAHFLKRASALLFFYFSPHFLETPPWALNGSPVSACYVVCFDKFPRVCSSSFTERCSSPEHLSWWGGRCERKHGTRGYRGERARRQRNRLPSLGESRGDGCRQEQSDRNTILVLEKRPPEDGSGRRILQWAARQ